MIYKQELITKNVTPGTNTRQFIIVHDTATNEWSVNWVLKTLTTWKVSCHYVIDYNWDKYKIWWTEQILWHAGVSEWKWLKDMNRYSIWIEVVWWNWKEFSYEQRVSVKELIQHLMATFNIPKENVLRHKDIAPGRKIDIEDQFWNNKYKSWEEYQNSLVPKKM